MELFPVLAFARLVFFLFQTIFAGASTRGQPAFTTLQALFSRRTTDRAALTNSPLPMSPLTLASPR